MGQHGSIFAFGLVAFGFLCMGPVNIAVDSYGPVTDNAQSVFELAQTEHIPGVKEEIQRDFGFVPDFERGKHYLEANDSAGNTFKATAKPVLIGTAVVGATTMIFSIILLLEKKGLLALSLTDAPVLLGFICGGAVVFWFSGASMQAVTTGAYRAVEYIKKNMNLDKKAADIEDSKTVVRICTEYAQSGMWNIFIALMSITLAFAFFDPNFFVAYLVSIAVFGLFQAIYMANAGGAWDNAKKLVEVDLKEKGTTLHAATVVGDTVGDPFKDTTSVALNDHQVLDAVRPARRRDRRADQGGCKTARRHRLHGRGRRGHAGHRPAVRVAVILRDADPEGTLSAARRPPVTQPREQPRHGPLRATAIPAFEPRIIPKQQRRIPGLDDKILALLHGYSSSRGNGTGSDVDIDPSISRAIRCAHAKRIYFFLSQRGPDPNAPGRDPGAPGECTLGQLTPTARER
jgi:hypothetical protein